MAVNLSKNGASLSAAYNEVVDGHTDTDWALFTYEGNSNDIHLAATGGGGLQQMVQELNSGKVMYGFCRVLDPSSGVAKFVLINWTGEGVKGVRKGICANHVQSMARFLRGAHVTINARSDDDVDPDAILNKVYKTAGMNNSLNSGTNSIHTDKHTPSRSVYKKVSASQEIQSTNKDSFWAQAEMEEKSRKQEERKRAEEEHRRLEEERNQQESHDSAERERRERERTRQIEQQRLLEKKLEVQNKEPKELRSVYKKVSAAQEIQSTNKDSFWAQAEMEEKIRKQEERRRAEEEHRRLEEERNQQESRDSAERERRERERTRQIEQQRLLEKKLEVENKEPKKLDQQQSVQQKGIRSAKSVQTANEAAAIISQRAVNPRDLFKQKERSSVTNGGPNSPTRPGRLKSQFFGQQSVSVNKPAQKLSHNSTPTSTEVVSTPVKTTPIQTTLTQIVPLENASTFPQQNLDLFSENPFNAEQTEESDDEWQDSDEDLYGAEENIYEIVPSDDTSYDPVNQVDVKAETEQNVFVRAIYDYQAVDETEITFDPGDVITDVEMLDEGWWRGRGPDGHFGMFPANYVELI